MSARVLSRVAALAAVYSLLTVLPPLNALGYGPIQVRVAEALTVLPFVFPWAPWGLYLGCILANLGSPFLVWDLTLGAFSSLAGAFLTGRMPSPLFAPLPPVIVNAVLVSIYVAPLSGMPYPVVALYIAAGQAVACYGLGYPLLAYILRNQRLREVLSVEQSHEGAV
ncbi:MAG TPA: QueT transporter family protein [Firmicutes bacterium]|nr:QueT transporter family protein [Candidatus Fermentithermobacillaceae bacterium]